jgi:hypothetical protein
VAQSDFAKLVRHQSGIVLADIDPVYLNVLLPDSFVAAPIDGNHHYKWSKIWRYDRPQALALIEHCLQHSVLIYALFVSRDDMMGKLSRLPVVPRYEWHGLADPRAESAILRLIPVASPEKAPSSG